MLKIKKTKNRGGFTLVELLVTIVIIAILASISVVAYKGIQGRARDAVRAQDIASIKKALLIYEQFHGGLPKTAAYGASLGSGGWDHSQRPEWLAFLS